MKLNGWQRLWLIISFVWIGCIVAYSIIAKQSESEIYHSWSQDLLSYLVTQANDLKGYSVTSLRSTYSGVSDKELVEALHKKYIGKHPAYRYGFSKIDAKYEKAISGRNDGKIETLSFAAIGFPVVLYLFGWAVGWVRRGFKGT